MCLPKLKRRLFTPSRDPSFEPAKTGQPVTASTPREGNETATPAQTPPILTNVSKPTDEKKTNNATLSKESKHKPKVADVHKRLKESDRARQTMDSEKRKREMEAAMKMLGCDANNTTIIQRLEKAHKSVMAVPKSERSTHSVKHGDITFTLGSRNKHSKDDDTMRPLSSASQPDYPTEDSKELEVGDENVEEDPNSENYMYNSREIKYCCVDMLRNIDKNILAEATGESLNLDDADEKVAWDPWAPIATLEARPLFDCTTLRRNTFISTTLACPTKEETDLRSTGKCDKKVIVHLMPKDLFSIRTPITALSTKTMIRTNSLDKTPQTEKSGSYKSAMVGPSTRTTKPASVRLPKST
uniref:Uncharacterized protein n=1 Tax=Panagrellus redivivus TaxID=6233 RepID=A0A7E4VI23_PANRE